MPFRVATVESISIVTAEEPLYEPPNNPVPIVSALVAVAVTVTEPPKLTLLPLIVIELFVRLELPMFDRVFVEPLMLVPANVVIVPPKETEVDPIVIALLAS